jgi:hypothetical protein
LVKKLVNGFVIYNRLLKASDQHGTAIYTGSPACFIDYIKECRNILKFQTGFDVNEAKMKVKTQFALLVNYLREEDIIQMWRDAIASQIHED